MTARVALIGCGNIAPAYVKGMAMFPDDVQLVACADINQERAQLFAEEYNIRAHSVDDLLKADDIDIIVNLTIPAAHSEVSLQVLDAGKHVYSEKPLALDLAAGKRVIDLAAEKGLRVGCAPDTFLGAGGQTSRAAIDRGDIGRPVAGTAFMVNHGPETWHPNPFFYYAPGGGPMFDMGPYYLTTLISLLGPVVRVSGSTGQALEERVAGHESIAGQKVPVTTATHYAGTLDFESGAIVTIIMSFDVWRHRLPIIDIYGTDGSLAVPDPNQFRGTVSVWDTETRDWQDIPSVGRDDIQRGAGVADMARGIRDGVPHRASGELAYHVLEIMSAFGESSESGQHVTIKSRAERPEPFEV